MSKSTLVLVVATMALSGCGWWGRVADPMRPGRAGPGVSVRHDGGLMGYRRFTIDPVRLVMAPGVEMDPAVRDELAAQVRREMVVRLAGRYEIIEPPGAGVLRLSVNVVGVRPGPAMGLADARMEALVTESVTGEPLLLVQDQRSPRPLVDPELFTESQNARNIMRHWADAVGLEIEAAEGTTDEHRSTHLKN